MTCKLTWYGHCCFKVEYGQVTFLLDPYDTFKGIDLGRIEADYILTSSSWHDHGHIGASPHSHILSYEGKFDFGKGFYIHGSKAKESRGSSTMIYTVVFQDGFAFTNFADWGEIDGDKQLNEEDLVEIKKTKLAFMRINYIDLDQDLYCYDLARKVCDSDVIVPIHYFPQSFVKSNIPEKHQEGYIQKLSETSKMKGKIGFPLLTEESYSTELSFPFEKKAFLQFEKIHPQVRYTE